LFGFGGGHPPDLGPVADSISNPLGANGPAANGTNDQPWNEQLPGGVGTGGILNTGTVFGSGNTSPYVFSALADSSGSWLENAPTIPSWLVNGIAGAGDKFTTIPFTKFSVTAWARNVIPGGDSTNTNSSSYQVGGWLGTGFQVFFGSAVGGTAAAVANGKNGAYFGRGTATVFSSGRVRFGWGWKGPAVGGKDVIRLGIGPPRGTSWWSHIIFWYPKVS
jgi:hypothetical protein